MKAPLLTVLMLVLAACAVPQAGMKRSGGGIFGTIGPAADRPFVDEIIEVVTEPPGARIQVNDDFAGYAPVRYNARRLWHGEPGSMVLDTVKIDALPVAAGQCAQSGTYGQHNLKVPFPVRFTMTSCAAAQPAGQR